MSFYIIAGFSNCRKECPLVGATLVVRPQMQRSGCKSLRCKRTAQSRLPESQRTDKSVSLLLKKILCI